jgi:light-regulated signal transduction histidine kinase (bacteriophytochrome)
VAARESGATTTIGELPAIKVRESHLAQVFQNLLGNAIKYRRDDRAPAIELLAKRG